MRAKQIKVFMLILLSQFVLSCYFVDYFESDETTQESSSSSTSQASVVLGDSLGAKAGDVNESGLSEVYATVSTYPPASIRPDPDMYARRLLLQHRAEGEAVAKEIGSIEDYRLLLGGASLDFQKNPQEDFDATSLLANISVAERICQGLVAPDESTGWESILPARPADWQTNITFLAQRFFGVPSSEISSEIISSLKTILDSNTESTLTQASYISVCTALALDAESIFI